VALLLSSPPNACRCERRRVWGLCPALLRTILAAAETGAPLKSCRAVAGISYETLRGWILEEPEIGEKLVRARERARVAALRVLREAWKKDWCAAAEFLRLGFREDYSARGGIPVETANVLPGQIIVDTALLEELSRAYDESIATTTREPGQNQG
jgi:hypothetical protein